LLDIKYIRAEPEAVKAGAAKKRITCDVDAILVLDKEVREMGAAIDEMRNRQKTASKKIGEAPAADRPKLGEPGS